MKKQQDSKRQTRKKEIVKALKEKTEAEKKEAEAETEKIEANA